MTKIKTVSVYCGSSLGKNKVYLDKAKALGTELHRQDLNLVYGGGNIGLMGVIANTVLQAGGKVTGILPRFLNKKEVGNLDIDKLILVNSMHERKQMISELSDAFIAMPGGYGTLEEVTEMLTWGQLGLIKKPIGLYNINGFYDLLLAQFDRMVEEGFLKPENRRMVLDDDDPEKLIEKLFAYEPISIPKWLHSDQT
ncbi:MAG: TIGR00730 family Rossman fold protein [Bacteroidota bacterium]